MESTYGDRVRRGRRSGRHAGEGDRRDGASRRHRGGAGVRGGRAQRCCTTCGRCARPVGCPTSRSIWTVRWRSMPVSSSARTPVTIGCCPGCTRRCVTWRPHPRPRAVDEDLGEQEAKDRHLGQRYSHRWPNLCTTSSLALPDPLVTPSADHRVSGAGHAWRLDHRRRTACPHLRRVGADQRAGGQSAMLSARRRRRTHPLGQRGFTTPPKKVFVVETPARRHATTTPGSRVGLGCNGFPG